jgi:hypothetical protein
MISHEEIFPSNHRHFPYAGAKTSRVPSEPQAPEYLGRQIVGSVGCIAMIVMELIRRDLRKGGWIRALVEPKRMHYGRHKTRV